MSALAGRLPVREHLRPKPRRRLIDSLDPAVLQTLPALAEIASLVPFDVFVGPGRLGPGWDGWEYGHVSLDFALALPVGGEA